MGTKVIVASALIFAGGVRQRGYACELEDDQAERLKAKGLVMDPADYEAEADLDPAARVNAIADAITGLESNGENFTSSGLPRVKAVEAALGYDVDADEVKAAWALLEKD